MNQYTLIKGKTDLRTTFPNVAVQWDEAKNGDLTPEDVQPASGKKVWWVCSLGHSWQAVISSRTAGKGCPYCAGRKVMPGFNDLQTVNPELAAQWNYEKNGTLLPTEVTGMSHRKAWWTGVCGHAWRSQIANRSNGNGCPYCAGRMVLEGFNDAKSRCPELMMEWDYEKNQMLPERVTAGSQKEIWWKCGRGHSWKAKLMDRSRGTGCPYCCNRKVLRGENDLASIHPELLPEWDYQKNGGIRPDRITYQSRKKVWWICVKGHSWKAEIFQRVNGGTGCPVCARRKDRHPVRAGETDLLTVNPELASEWDYERNAGLTPEQVRPFSTRKVWWVCDRGHHWQCTIQIRQRGTGCPFCDGRIHRQSRLI